MASTILEHLLETRELVEQYRKTVWWTHWYSL